AFKCGHAFLEHARGRVHDTGIDIARYLEIEQIGPMLRTVESVRCSLIDGNGNGLRGGIGLVTGVNRKRFKFHGRACLSMKISLLEYTFPWLCGRYGNDSCAVCL